MDLATIGFEADTGPLKKAEQDLDALVEKADEVDQATKKVKKSTREQADAAAESAKVSREKAETVADAAEREVSAMAKATASVKAEAAAVKQAATAAEQSGSAHNAAGAALAGVGQKAALTRMQMMTLQYTMNDVVASMASGTPPMTILMQQGGQVTQAFGGLTGTLRALTTFMANPYVMALGATVAATALLVAITDDVDEATEKFNRTLELTGNYAGVTKGTIDDLARTVALATGVSVDNATQVGAQLVATGQYSSRVISQMTMIIADYAQKTEMEISDASDFISKAFANPAKGAEELNKRLHFLSYAQLQNIKNLQEQNRLEEAQIALGNALGNRLDETSNHVGLLAGKWLTLKKFASEAWDAMSFRENQTSRQRYDAANETLLRAMMALKNPNLDATSRQRYESQVAAQKAIIAEIDGQDRKAEEEGRRRQQESVALSAAMEIDATIKTFRTKEQLRKDELDKVQKLFATEGLLQQKYNGDVARMEEDKAKAVAGIEAKYKERRVRSDPIETAYQREKLQLAQEIAKYQGEIDLAISGGLDMTRQHVTALETWLANNREAKKLTDQQVESLREQATLADYLANKAREESLYRQYMVDADKQHQQALLDVQSIKSTGGTSPYRAYDSALQSFEPGGANASVTDWRRMQQMLDAARQVDRDAQEKLLASTSYAYEQQLDKLRQQNDLIGRTAYEQEKLNALYAIEEDFKRKAVGLDGVELDNLRQMTDAQKAKVSSAIDDKYRRDPSALRALDSSLGGSFADQAQAQSLQQQAQQNLMLLQQFREAEILTEEQYADRKRAVQQKLADDLMDIQTARMSMELQTASQGFDSLASITKEFAGEQSGAYKAMFVVSKAFAIADSLVQISNGVAKAANNPWPVNLAAMASVAAAGASVIANIRSVKDGFMDGGFTGNGGRSDVAGVVHRGEYVFDAPATSAIGVQKLEAIRRGKPISGDGNRPLNVTVVNQSSAQVTPEINYTTPDDVRIILRDEVPKIVAKEASDPYSRFSKAQQQNTNAGRKY